MAIPTNEPRGPRPITLPLENYLTFFSARSVRLEETSRFTLSLCVLFASLFATSLVAVVGGSAPQLLWVFGVLAGVGLAALFYFEAYYYNWTAYQFEAICWEILGGRLRSPEHVMLRWNQLLEVAKKEAPIMYRWAKMGSETFVLEKPKDEENKFT